MKALLIGVALALSLTLCGCATQGSNGSDGQTASSNEKVVTDGNSQSFTNEAPSETAPYVKEGGWTYIDDEAAEPSINYAAILATTNTKELNEQMTLSVTARDADGKTLNTYTDTIEFIAPDDMMPVCGSLSVEAKPASVEITIDDVGTSSTPESNFKIGDLKIANENEATENDETQWSGTVSNETGVNFDGFEGCVILKQNGGIIGGYKALYPSVSIDNGESQPFKIVCEGSVIDHDAYDLYAVPLLAIT